MSNRISFAQLERVLGELGYQKRVVPRKAVVYDHSTGPSLYVALHKANEQVPGHVLGYIRQQLDVFGIIERADFEGMLQAVAA